MRTLLPALAASLTAALAFASALHAQAGITPNGARRASPSTRATTEVILTLVDTAAQRAAGTPALIRIEYGQPHLRSRRINSDSLVPFDEVWRLGANAATLLTTDVDLLIGGQAVPRGRYVLHALPTSAGWTLILQRETTGALTVLPTAYNAAKDAARVDLTATTLSTPLESLSIWLVPSTAPGAQRGDLRIGWGTALLHTEWVVR